MKFQQKKICFVSSRIWEVVIHILEFRDKNVFFLSFVSEHYYISVIIIIMVIFKHIWSLMNENSACVACITATCALWAITLVKPITQQTSRERRISIQLSINQRKMLYIFSGSSAASFVFPYCISTNKIWSHYNNDGNSRIYIYYTCMLIRSATTPCRLYIFYISVGLILYAFP